MYAIDEDDSEHVDDATDNEEDLLAWCLSEESEHEQWQDVVIRRDKQQGKEAAHVSLLIAENNRSSSPKDTFRVTLDSGAACHMVLEEMLPRVKLQQNITKHMLWQRMVNKSETWAKIQFHSRQTREFKDA